MQPLILSHVLNGIDLIVGMDTLEKYQATLECTRGTTRVVTKGKGHWLKPVQEAKPDPYISVCTMKQMQAEVLSAKQAAKQLKKGAASWLMLVKPEDKALGIESASATCASVVGAKSEGLMQPEVLAKVQKDFGDVFQPRNDCPPHRFDTSHMIKLMPNATPTYKRPYRLSRVEEQEV